MWILIKLEIFRLEKEDNCVLRLYDINGKEILSSPITDTLATFDTSSMKAGYYILQVIVNEGNVSWKFKY